MKINKIGVVGFGNMAEAIVAGMMKSNVVKASDVYALEPNKKRAAHIKKKYKICFVNNYEELCSKTNAVLISVKPQNSNDVLPQLSKHLAKHLVLSIVTGVRLKKYEAVFNSKSKIIRIMPNTPALIGYGMAAYMANKNCTQTDKKICETIFNSVGSVIEIKNEALLDVITAISGSGPAFAYQYAQAMILAGQKIGLNPSLAKQLVLQTMLGAVNMMLKSGDSIEELTQKVTSKGGTTFEGLKTLKKKGFYSTIESCIKAATARAKELSQ